MPSGRVRVSPRCRIRVLCSIVVLALAATIACSARLDLGSTPEDSGLDAGSDADADSLIDADEAEAVPDRDDPVDGASDGDDDDAGEPSESCPLPQLLIAVESFDGSAGRIARLVITAEPSFERCPDLTGRSGLPSQPFAVTPLAPFGPPPGRAVAIASWDGMFVVDESTDEVLYFHPLEWAIDRLFPLGIAAIVGPEALPLLAVGYGDGTTGRIHTLHLYDPTARELAASIPLGRWIASIAPSPLDDERLLGLLSSSYDAAAAEIDPWTGTFFDSPPYVDYPAGQNLVTISTIRQDEQSRSVWVGRRENAEAEDDDVLYHLNDDDGSSGQTVRGPTLCGEPPRGFHDAVPDPTDPDLYFALLEFEGTRSVVRLSRSAPLGPCETVVDAPGEDARFSALAVAH